MTQSHTVKIITKSTKSGEPLLCILSMGDCFSIIVPYPGAPRSIDNGNEPFDSDVINDNFEASEEAISDRVLLLRLLYVQAHAVSPSTVRSTTWTSSSSLIQVNLDCLHTNISPWTMISIFSCRQDRVMMTAPSACAPCLSVAWKPSANIISTASVFSPISVQSLLQADGTCGARFVGHLCRFPLYNTV